MVNDPTRPVGAVYYEAPTIAELDAQLAGRSLEEAIHRARYLHSEPGPMDRSDAEYADRIAGTVRKWLALQAPEPIPMVLHCPACGVQHIDEPSEGWDNPPHRSHKCGGCGIIWRVADVPTVGVPESALKTSSAADTWPIVKEVSDRGDELAPVERRPIMEGLECEPPIMAGPILTQAELDEYAERIDREVAPHPTAHARTSPGPVNCLLRIMAQGAEPRSQPTKCERCGGTAPQACIFFEPDGTAKAPDGPPAPKWREPPMQG